MKSKNTKSTFRFPFDIDTRIFLVLAIIFFLLSFDGVRSKLAPSTSLKTYCSNIEKDLNSRIGSFENFLKDSVVLERLLNRQTRSVDYEMLQDNPFYFFLYRHDSLVFWSTNEIMPSHPPPGGLPMALESRKGKYMAFSQTIHYGGQTALATAVIPIKYENPYNSANFRTNFVAGDQENEFGMKLSVTPEQASLPVRFRGVTLYHIYRKDDFFSLNDKSGWRLFFNALPFIFFGISIHTYFKVEVKKRSPLGIYLALLLTALTIRLLNYYLNLPTDFSLYSLFDNKFFATDFFNRSLGDTFINVCLLFWFLLFFAVNVQGKVLEMGKKTLLFRVLFTLPVVLLMITGAIYLSNLVYELIQDSVINFDTTIFSRMDLFSFIGILTFMTIFANFLMGVIITNTYFNSCLPGPFMKYLMILASYFIFILVYQPPYPFRYEYAFISMGVIMFLLDKPNFKFRFDFNSYILLTWIILVSLAGAYVLAHFIEEKEALNRLQYAGKLLREGDRQMEERIHQLASNIHEDTSLVIFLQNPEGRSISALQDYVQQKYLGNNFIRYKTELHFFDALSQNVNPADTLESIGSDTLRTRQNELLAQSPFASISLLDAKNEKGYIAHIPILHQGKRAGSMIIKLQKPILLQKEDYTEFIYQDDIIKRAKEYNYSTAIYNHGVIEIQKGPYEFPDRIPQKDMNEPGSSLVKNGPGHTELWYHDEVTDKMIIVSKAKNSLYLFTTLFAYMFLIYFIVITLYILGNIIARSNLNYSRFLNLLSLNLRLRIHVAIIVVILISFIAVGIYTSNYFIQRLIDKNRSEISSFSQSLQNDISEYLHFNIVQNQKELDSLLQQPYTQKNLKEYAEKFRININLFNIQSGELLFTTEPAIFDNGLLVKWVNPRAFHIMNYENRSHFINNEFIGDLDFMASYSFIRNQQKQNIALMQLPYISSNTEISSETTTLIVTLINIFVLVFLFSSLLALLITNSVTRPFTYIVKQFTKINLTKTNQPLKWNYSDEIGLLVKEYNRMLRKLENSTVLLAKSEREMAWREMAKQVAHEIKNPLTPMKLSLQMLERAIKNNNPNVPEITGRVTNTLIEQIDNLTLIATNFSSFAKMPDMKKEYFVLNDVLYSVTGMYNDDKQNEYLFLIPEYSITVYADKSQLIRVFTNIIQNAIQAIPTDRKGNISMLVSKVRDNFVRVSISDNGEGISKEKGEKLFQPYFTTKSSGTGLGLAMCKDIIEQFGGKIWYESTVNEGTTFHIDLPVIDTEDPDFDL